MGRPRSRQRKGMQRSKLLLAEVEAQIGSAEAAPDLANQKSGGAQRVVWRGAHIKGQVAVSLSFVALLATEKAIFWPPSPRSAFKKRLACGNGRLR